jgi:threonine synthase
MILDSLRESGGMAMAVGEDSISEMQTFAGRLGAGYVSPESAAAFAAVPVLRDRGEIGRNDEIVVFDCGIGQKYPPPQDLPEPPVVDPADLDIDSLARSVRESDSQRR